MGYPFFYNSVDGDRTYDADSFSDWLKKFFTTGVFSGDLQVQSTSGMNILVKAGYVNINGKVKIFSDTQLTVPTAESTYWRVDNVVIERNDTNRDFTLKIVSGTPGSQSGAAGVAPTRSGSIYQLVIARIKVGPGVTYITQADITDTRSNKNLCGIVAGTVKEMDFTQFSAQFDAYLSAFKTSRAADFDDWFENIQDILDEDTAGNLQNEIEDRVDMSEPYLELDTTAASGTTDGDLYAAITARGWGSEVIISD